MNCKADSVLPRYLATITHSHPPPVSGITQMFASRGLSLVISHYPLSLELACKIVAASKRRVPSQQQLHTGQQRKRRIVHQHHDDENRLEERRSEKIKTMSAGKRNSNRGRAGDNCRLGESTTGRWHRRVRGRGRLHIASDRTDGLRATSDVVSDGASALRDDTSARSCGSSSDDAAAARGASRRTSSGRRRSRLLR